MNSAKSKKDDEWYTRYEDIAKEVPHYAHWLRGKVILCPCDDPRKSRFYKYFKDNFSAFGLRGLITSHLESPHSFWTEYDGKTEQVHNLIGNGDFASPEVAPLFKRADVVVTNPPFSLIPRFVKVLRTHKVQYLFIAPMTILYYQSNQAYNEQIYPLVLSKKMRVGFNMVTKFDNKSTPLGNVSWVTSFPVPFKPAIPLTYSVHDRLPRRRGKDCKYEIVESSPIRTVSSTVVMHNMLNVPYIDLIPYDWEGLMAVPATILYHWNPAQFQILGHAHKMVVEGDQAPIRIIIKTKKNNR